MMDFHLAAKRKLVHQAESTIKKCSSEETVLETLLKNKSKTVGCNLAFHADFHDVDEEIKFYVEQFHRKGLSQKSERFQYLSTTLRSKLKHEPETFYSLMGFLLEMENHSTNDIEPNLVKTKHYSSEPDLVEVVSDHGDVKRKRNAAEFREEIIRELKECLVPNEHAKGTTSEDSDLSDWSTDDENEKEPIVIKVIKPIPEGVIQDKTETFCDAVKSGDSIKDETPTGAIAHQNWKNSYAEATVELKKNLDLIKLKPLKHCPSISSYEDLTLKFGEFWESYQLTQMKLPRKEDIMKVAAEEGIVREILWHFTTPDSCASVIFKPDWSLKPVVMTSTLTHYTLANCLNEIGHTLSKLDKMKKFIKSSNQYHSFGKDGSMVLEAFAHSVSEILTAMSVSTALVYDNYVFLKPGSYGQGPKRPISTILQLIRHCLRPHVATVNALDVVFIQVFGQKYDVVDFDNLQPWLISVMILSSVEMFLKIEGRVSIWNQVFYLYCQCLRAYCYEFFSALDGSKWAVGCPFFRNESIDIHDTQFWNSCISVQPYRKAMKETGVPVATFIQHLEKESLGILKILEMLRLLGEDGDVITKAEVDSELLLQKYLHRILPLQFELPNVDASSSCDITHTSQPTTEMKTLRPYINYLHLSDKRIFHAFQSTVKSHKIHSREQCATKVLNNYKQISSIPTENVDDVLTEVIVSMLESSFIRAKESLRAIFKHHNVMESLKLFQEIILGAREDFSQAVFLLAKKSKTSPKLAYEPEHYRNPLFQKLLNECYPEGRECFEISFFLDSSHDLNFKFVVKPLFPLNLILSPESIKKYMFVSHQLLRIRKSLWGLNSLNMKACKPSKGVNLHRVLLFRFALVHFASSLRAFLMFKILSLDAFRSRSPHQSDTLELEEITKAHDEYLHKIDSKLMRIKFIHAIVIQKITSMSDYLLRSWSRGIDLTYMIKLEDCLKQCWSIVSDFCASPVSAEFTELFYYVGSPPGYLIQN